MTSLLPVAVLLVCLSQTVADEVEKYKAHKAALLTETLSLMAKHKLADTDELKLASLRYMEEFGYLPESPILGMSRDEKAVENGLKEFQSFAGLPVTGKLDEATVKQMSLPRCGLKDSLSIKANRKRRYVHQGSTWKKTHLTWVYLASAYPSKDLDKATVLSVMRQAIHMWSSRTNIDFTEISEEQNAKQEADILVSFRRGSHQDPYPFDGQGGTLAHAYYPHNNKGLSGDVHFDDDEWYTHQSSRGRNLLWVATHELGHSLGLDHSNEREAVMYPWYTKYKPGFDLKDDDILGIQLLYGGKVKPTHPDITTKATPPVTTVKPTQPDITTRQQGTTSSPGRRCPEGEITAIYFNKRYSSSSPIMFTKTDKFYLLGRDVPATRERDGWFSRTTIPDQINAIFSTAKILNNKRDEIVIFAGDKYYVYHKFNTLVSGPHSIHDGSGPMPLLLPPTVTTIDAAFLWPRNGRVYFFSGENYWRYNIDAKRIDSGYPKLIRNEWRGLPGQIDAAMPSPSSNQETFFFKGKKFYVFDDVAIQLKAVYPIERFYKCGGAIPYPY